LQHGSKSQPVVERPFQGRLRVALAVSSILVGSVALAQPERQPPVKLEPGETIVPGECLTKEELDLNRALQALTRPTIGVERPDGDDPLRFNPHYFVGKWTIEGVIPESALGPAGEMMGVETVRHVDSCIYESTTEIKAPGGTYKVDSLIVYDRQAGYMVRRERDSRGFELLKTGVVGGDPGGYFSHHWEAPAIAYKGTRLRLKGTTFLASPENYRLRMQLSPDGQSFTNYGTIWWRREGPVR
jgi:hypothetical protein